jgi:hypothetical protein
MKKNYFWNLASMWFAFNVCVAQTLAASREQICVKTCCCLPNNVITLHLTMLGRLSIRKTVLYVYVTIKARRLVNPRFYR